MELDSIGMHGEDQISDAPAFDDSGKHRLEQRPLVELVLDVSGDDESPSPIAASGEQCSCCSWRAEKLWQGARAGNNQAHVVCTLCYLTGHLDSPTSAHGRLAYLPGLAMPDAINLQRRALLNILGGSSKQKKEGLRIWKWMDSHAREVEVPWGTARAADFAHAMKRLTPSMRSDLQQRLRGSALILPADMFQEPSLLLPKGKTIQAAIASYSWPTYKRSEFYVEVCALG